MSIFKAPIKIEKGKKIKNEPGYHFDSSKHRWIIDEFKQDLASQSRGVQKKDIIDRVISRLIENGALSPDARKLPFKQKYALVYGLKEKTELQKSLGKPYSQQPGRKHGKGAGHIKLPWKILRIIELKNINDKLQNNNILFHWTEYDRLKNIIESSFWEAGSTTTDPHYRFGSGQEKGESIFKRQERYGLLFDRTRIDKKYQEEIKGHVIVPWDEKEIIINKDIDLWGEDEAGAKTPFIGFIARTVIDAERIRSAVRRNFDDVEMKDWYDIYLLKGNSIVRYNNANN